jgi:hypothetical protein
MAAVNSPVKALGRGSAMALGFGRPPAPVVHLHPGRRAPACALRHGSNLRRSADVYRCGASRAKSQATEFTDISLPSSSQSPSWLYVNAAKIIAQKWSRFEPRFAALMEALARRTSVRRPTLSTWKTNPCANASWRLQLIHCSFVKRPLNGQQGHELATRSADDRMDKGFLTVLRLFKAMR